MKFDLPSKVFFQESPQNYLNLQSNSIAWKIRQNVIALMHDDIRQANFTTKPRFENANCKFYREQIPKAAKMKRMPA